MQLKARKLKIKYNYVTKTIELTGQKLLDNYVTRS